MNRQLPARRIVPMPARSSGGGEGTSGGTTEPSREYANRQLTDTRFTHAEPPRAETCFLCRFVGAPADTSDPLAAPEANVIARMRTYWDQNVTRMDFHHLAEDCARLFKTEYSAYFVLPAAESGDGDADAAAPDGGAPSQPCVADADMIYQHFTVHEGTAQTRRAVMKRAYQQQFEFLEQNKKNGFVSGKHGKRVPDREAEAAHAKGCLVLLKMGAYLDRFDDIKS
jgi:hypothetical protein